MNELQGWLNINKPVGISSFEVIKKIKKKFKINKIGHGGTLDPLAEGVLPIAIGKTTKLIPFINNEIKIYEFEIKWGESTLTDDAEGKIIEFSNNIPSTNDIRKKISQFKGFIWQEPPKASAIKINGERAYKMLRQNKEFQINKKKVEIFECELLDSNFDNKISKMRIKSGKGFYIRSFARDLAELLETKGHVNSLKRTKVGKFDINSANLLDDLLKIGQTLSEFKGFQPSVSMLDDILAFEIIDERNKIRISQGKSINIDKSLTKNTLINSAERKIVFLTEKGNVISFGRLNGDLFKPKKVLI